MPVRTASLARPSLVILHDSLSVTRQGSAVSAGEGTLP